MAAWENRNRTTGEGGKSEMRQSARRLAPSIQLSQTRPSIDSEGEPMRRLALLLAIMIAAPCSAQNVDPAPGFAQLASLPVPVVAGDITDRPYRVIGVVEAGVRKATIFSGSPSQAKVYRELWERGKKLGADAVIFATYGESRITALSWGSREASGKAIKFLSDGEIAAMGSVPVPATPVPPTP